MGFIEIKLVFCNIFTVNMVNSSLAPHENFIEFLLLSMQETRDLGAMIVQQGYK